MLKLLTQYGKQQFFMQTDLITITCTNNVTGTDNVCTTPSFFSGGEMFISLLLLIGLILAIIVIIKNGIFSVDVHRKFLGNNSQEGKENYKI
jgi:hypothetical protein